VEPPLSNLVVSPEAVVGIEALLRELVRESSATSAVLLDRSGQVICVAGDSHGLELVSLGALLAGNFASAREIARLLHEPSFSLTFQQGEREHVLTATVGPRCLLSILFRAQGQLGLVKVLAHQAATNLAIVIEASSRQALANDNQLNSFRLAADDGIDRWFREQEDKRLD
jgi:predicted regulator of Ras-like GTPase activity (Roadblock/LC7/MglB family)